MPGKILVIDDHEETIRVVKFILEQRGYTITSASSGSAGLSLAEMDKPDLILLDVMMPGMNGVEVCRRLRADTNFDDVPIIMFTAKDQVGDKWAGFEAGADDYLTKPTDPDELDRRIKVLLRRASHGEEPVEPVEPLPMTDMNLGDSQTAAATPDETAEQLLLPADLPPPPEKQKAAPNLMAVVGVRGGVGTTTIAINLAASLADYAGQTYLVDLDLVQGHIALYLQRKIQHESLNDLSRIANPLELARRWQKFTLPEGPGLQLLLSRPNIVGDCPIPSPMQIEVLIETLVQTGHFIVVDIGRGFSPATLPVLHQAGHILVCTQAERVSLLAAKRLLKDLPAHIGQGARPHVLMTTMGLDSSLPQPAVEEFIQHELMATVPLSHKDMSYAANYNAPLVRLRTASKAAEVFRKIIEKVVV